MTKYFIFAEGSKKPIRKFKHQYEAVNFATDFRNLSEHGCMTLVMETDNDGRYIWNEQNDGWEKVNSAEGISM